MSSSEILEGNRLIAGFNGMYCLNEYARHKGGTVMFYQDMRYHSSWEWIMPVVEKIESIKDPNECERFYVSIVGERCIIRDSLKSLDIVCDNECITKIGAVFKSVVEFIKWYNQQSK